MKRPHLYIAGHNKQEASKIFLNLKEPEQYQYEIIKIIRLKKKVQPGHIGASYPLTKQFLYSIYYKRKWKKKPTKKELKEFAKLVGFKNPRSKKIL